MSKKSTSYPDVLQEEIAAAKEKYGAENVRIAEIPLDDDGNEHIEVLVRVPDRKTIGEFEKWADKDPNKSKEIVINQCLLSHKEIVKAKDDLFFTTFGAIADTMPIRKGKIKNC